MSSLLSSADQTCTPEEFTCDNGNCIQKKWLCDLEDDCGDGSDERKCPDNKCDVDNDFACGNGYCITKRWRCDGDLDCPDATDEMVSLNISHFAIFSSKDQKKRNKACGWYRVSRQLLAKKYLNVTKGENNS